MNWTVPVGVPAPGATALSAVVKVTAVPGSDGLAEEVKEDGCCRRRDRQSPTHEVDRVIGTGRATGGDGIAAHGTGRRRRGGQSGRGGQAAGRVPVDKPAVGGSQRWHGRAVELARVGGGDGQGLRQNDQRDIGCGRQIAVCVGRVESD